MPRKRLFCQENDITSDRRFACRLHPAHGPLPLITSHSRFALASTMRKTKRLRRRLSHGKATQQNEETYIGYIAKCSVLMTVRTTVHEIRIYSIQQKKIIVIKKKINEQTAKKDMINSFLFNYNSRINIWENVPEVYGLGRYSDEGQVSPNTDRPTILDKTVEKIAYLGAFFLNFVADRFFPPPLPLEAMLLGLQKKAGSLSICRKQLWIGGGGILYAKPLIWKQFCCVR